MSIANRPTRQPLVLAIHGWEPSEWAPADVAPGAEVPICVAALDAQGRPWIFRFLGDCGLDGAIDPDGHEHPTYTHDGSTPTGMPFTFLDTKTNTIEGVMVDVIKAVGKEAGFEVQIEPMAFSALIGSLTSRRIDLISAAMFITPPRLEVINFSEPVYSYGEGLMVPVADNKEYKTFDDM